MLDALGATLTALRQHRTGGLLVALSGGPDSMALLHGLLALGEQPRAVHIHHGIRIASDDEADLVTASCAARGVPCDVIRLDVPAYAATHRLSLETAARNCRYAALAAALRPQEILVLGHHAGDQAETVLQHLTRGSGLDGLTGMRVFNTAYKGLLCWRPLLSLSKNQLLSYCHVHHISYVLDDSNSDERYTRNAFRHTILPALAAINPQIEQALGRTALLLQQDAAALEAWTQTEYDKITQPELGGMLISTDIIKLPVAIASRVLRRSQAYVMGHGAPVDLPMAHVTQLLELAARPQSGAKLELHTLHAWKGYGYIYLFTVQHPVPAPLLPNATLRHRRAGDRMGSHKVSDILTNHRVQPWHKDLVWLAEREGRVIWMGLPSLPSGAAQGPASPQGCWAQNQTACNITWQF